MFRGLVFFTAIFVLCQGYYSQSRIGTWEDHVGLNSAVSMAHFNGKIYCSNYSSVFAYDETDNSVEKINKIKGLSDVGIKFVRNNPNNNRLIIVYENSNMDIIKSDNSISNYPDLFRKNFSGKKNVNEILFDGKMAYLSCGFGIALFDTEKLEIKDTYIIGPNGTNLEVLQFAVTDSLYYAATPLGLYKCRKDLLPNNYQNWKLITNGIPSGYYANVLVFNNTVLAAYSPFKESGITDKDTIFSLKNNNTWEVFQYHSFPYVVKKLKDLGNTLFFADNFGSLFLNTAWQNIAYVTQYETFATYPSDAIVKDQAFWIADLGYGLIKTGGSSPFYKPTFIQTNGINRSNVANIDIRNGKIVTAAIFIDSGGGATYSREGANVSENGEWSYLGKAGQVANSIVDQCHVLFDKKDPSRLWVSSWVQGLIEFKNNEVIKIHDGTNTGGAIEAILPNWWRVSGKDMDEEGNLWFAVSDVTKIPQCKKTNGAFQNFSFDGAARFVRKVLCDQNGQVWILHERDQGLTVAKFNKSTANYSVQSYKILNKNTGSGNLGSNSVYSIVEDLDGKIWVGTSAGIRIFNSPSTILSGGPVDGEPIKIVQDGNVELLLDAEVVTCIDIDAANNKWVGTIAGGVYCFSSDGQRQLFHFTADNSSLYSNEIVDLKVNGKTGDVYIASSIGLQSYKNVIIDGEENYSGIYAYPNPVKPNYTGNVYVTGLVDNSVVKIADEYGNFVWETKSQGGRIEWPLKTFAGNKVSSGVYIVYAATTTAELKAVTKVLVMN
ncbi:MAG: hypothetical protein IPG08_06295 [Sphingobacteriaceae bacterium]|nr:hypothetical protein [Sphingobacteriaceae bacterium]